MTLSQWLRRLFAPLLLSLLLLVTACNSRPPSEFQQAQKESTQPGKKAVAKEAVAGGKFNKFFPKSQDGYQVIFTQEKKGFAEAKLKKGDRDMAMLAVSDIISTPATANKFASSSEKIQGYPLADQGSTGTAILVKDRFQVKVLSRDASFTKDNRKAWLAKFNLSGLAKLKK